MLKKALTVAMLIALATPLASCMSRVRDLEVFDTGSEDADRFVEQTRPVWTQPVSTDVVKPAATDPTATDPIVTHSTLSGFSIRPLSPEHVAMYSGMMDDGHRLPPIPANDVDPSYLRKEIAWRGAEFPGTIIVDTASRHLYFVLSGGRAIRYGVGIGRQGYAWKGQGIIGQKRTWPKWTPSDDYVAEKPEMKMFSASYGGLVGGINNPLGARALYIYADGHDTLYRVHGTPDWKSVGKQVSSGCVRMFNQDVIDLYNRVSPGAVIIVR
jgi:lipoprotein-anchoring transpeptidase ErfK/SrfK